jgi:gliding motility-associated-like protein
VPSEFSAYSDEVVFEPLGVVDSLVPQAPVGLWAQAQAEGSGVSIVLHWKAPLRNRDGSLLSDLAGYRVYRSSALASTGLSLVSTTTALSFTDAVPRGSVHYYRIRAFDGSGNASDHSTVLEASGDGRLLNIVSPADGTTDCVSLSMDSARQLLSENNGLNEDLVVIGTRIVPEEVNGVARSVRFDVHRAHTGGAVSTFHFRSAQAEVVLGHSGIDSSSWALYWFNGVEWIKAGGTVDEASHTVRLTTSRMGRYQIRPAVPNLAGELIRVYPQTFTPNGDGWNDKVVFEVENPAHLSVEGHIYDVRGTRVGSLSPFIKDNTFMWDGLRDGQWVPGGIYFYRIEIGGQTKDGSLVVVR